MRSCSKRAFNSAVSIRTLTVSISASNASRTALTRAPAFGRSSGDNLPRPFSNAVTSPFLPKYLTRISCSDFISVNPLIASRASALIRCNSSFIKASSYI